MGHASLEEAERRLLGAGQRIVRYNAARPGHQLKPTGCLQREAHIGDSPSLQCLAGLRGSICGRERAPDALKSLCHKRSAAPIR